MWCRVRHKLELPNSFGRDQRSQFKSRIQTRIGKEGDRAPFPFARQ
jgi:hypothetical protein